MNRWWGSKADSDKQSSERDQRAARRRISELNLNLSEDEEDFKDCDTSINNTSIWNLDGQVDEDVSSVASDLDMDAAELARQKALPVEDSDFENDPKAWEKELKLKFDKNDVKYWFNVTEAELKKFGINRQWDKKNAIAAMLPADITEEVKPILRLTQDEAGDHIYKDLKTEIVSLFGPREEDAFKKAMALRIGSGRPSAFGKKLIHAICPGAKPFDGCHCAKMVYGFWLN